MTMKLLFSAVRPCGLVRQIISGKVFPVTPASSTLIAQRLNHTDTSGSEKKKDARAIALSRLKDYVNLTKDISSTPAAPLALGLSGLIPFLYPPLSMMSQGAFDSSLMFAHLTYGATILSFIGGLRWGYCLSASSKTPPNWLYLGYSVTPQLTGWAALLMPTTPGVLTLIIALTLSAVADISMPGYPSWFISMRVILTTGAVLSLILSLCCSVMLK